MKKQLNYKSLNTLGDVDITQSVVPGGGEAEVKDTMEYVAFNAETDLETYVETLSAFTYFVKFPTKIETTSLMLATHETVEDAIAFAIDTEAVVDFMGSRKSIKDHALSIGTDISLLPHITKEEFYKLPVALTIYTYSKDVIAHQDEMKFAFDTLWAIWERDGVEGQELAITIPNADIASITEIGNEGTFAFNITSMRGGTTTSDSDTVTYIEFNGQYGPQISKVENLNTGEITYLYHFES